MKTLLLRYFPLLRTLKGWIVGFYHATLPSQDSYSQSEEDLIVCDLLKWYRPEQVTYIDVGGNHPTKLSNTYKLYRRGFSGFVVEPNRSLLKMHQVLRTRDTHLDFGCGEKCELLPFLEARNHVFSGFKNPRLKTNEIRRKTLIPVFPLDSLKDFIEKPIGVLSIDVEGLDLEVAKGAVEILRKTLSVIIEADVNRTEIVKYFTERGFSIYHETRHNLIFRNDEAIVSA